MLEKFFENAMWQTRLFVLFAVIFGLFGSITLFIVGSVDIFEVLKYTINVYSNGLHPEKFHEEIVSKIKLQANLPDFLSCSKHFEHRRHLLS